MKNLKQLFLILAFCVTVFSQLQAQSFDCPTVQRRNNGNSQGFVVSNYYYPNSIAPNPGTNGNNLVQGKITLLFATMPSVVPFISGVVYNGAQTNCLVGPPSVVEQVSNGYHITYTLYIENLPANNANYSLKFNAPNANGTAAGTFIKSCDYFGNGSLSGGGNNGGNQGGTPVITSQPTSVVNCGGSALFTVVATGNGNLSYQWRLNGTAISGATAASYSTQVEGSYDVVVSSSNASVTSSAATLTGDHINPSITAPNSVNAFTNSGCSATGVNLGTPVTADNCTVASVTNNAPAAFPLGNTLVTWTVTDGSGNTATATQNVTVADNVKPNIVTKNINVVLVNGSASIVAADIDNGSSDNCSIASMVIDNANFGCGNTGANTVTLTITDASGNVNSGVATVTVIGGYPAVPALRFVPAASSQNTYDNTPNKLYLGYGAQYGVIQVTNPANQTYGWVGNNLSGNVATTRTYSPLVGGTQTTHVTTTNSYGCSSNNSISICALDIRVAGGSPSNPKVYICHIPAGNTSNPQSLSVNVSAVPAHIGLHGGDRLGACNQVCGLAKNAQVSESIEAASDDMHMHISPNPIEGQPNFMVETYLGDAAAVSIFDMQGKLVWSGNIATNKSVSIDGVFTTGLYFVNAQVEGNSVQTKMIVK